MSQEISVRAATVEDAADVLEIERSCAEAPHWSEGAWAGIFVQHSQYLPSGTQPYATQRTCFVAQRGDATAGFIVVSVTGVAGIGNGVAEVESLAVRGTERRHGVGRSLCLQALFWAQTMGANCLQLEVRSASAAALALYRSLGFAEQGRRKRYYADPPDDAVLMTLSLAAKS